MKNYCLMSYEILSEINIYLLIIYFIELFRTQNIY